MKIHPRIKSHMIQQLRKYVRRAKWFGPVLLIEVDEAGEVNNKTRKLLGTVWNEVKIERLTEYETCGDEHCCGWTYVYSADFRTRMEKLKDWVSGVKYGPKDWKL